MKKIKAQQLTVEKFHRYGSFGKMINPQTDTTGPVDANIVFYRDMVVPTMFNSAPSFSVCRMKKRPLIIDFAEYHNTTSEVAMPLDHDAVIWVAPADCGQKVPTDKIEAFYVPQGTAFNINPGVWHHAAYAVNSDELNVMIVLPERVYVNDCVCLELPETEKIAIEL